MYESLSLSASGLSKSVSGGTALAPSPIGRVTEGYEQARKLVESIYQEISQLEGRIGSVLRPTGPSNAVGPSEKQRVEPSALGQGFEALNSQLYNILGYVQGISARVDL